MSRGKVNETLRRTRPLEKKYPFFFGDPFSPDVLGVYALVRGVSLAAYTTTVAEIAKDHSEYLIPVITALVATAAIDAIATASSLSSYQLPEHLAIRVAAYLTQLARFVTPIVLPSLLLASTQQHPLQEESMYILAGYVFFLLWPLFAQIWESLNKQIQQSHQTGRSKQSRPRQRT